MIASEGEASDAVVGPESFRTVLSHMPTGVAVITAVGSDGALLGVACNSFSSVSLEPPLVGFCPARSSETWPRIREVSRFCVNVMAQHHHDTCVAFARRGVDRFSGVPYHRRAGGPALDDAVAWLDCRIADEHDAGDHTIVVANVEALAVGHDSDVLPLVFYRGRYGTFTSHAD